MDKLVKVSADQTIIAEKIVYADTPRLRKMGVLGRHTLDSNEGVLLVMPPRLGLSLLYSIHMFGVPFGLAIAWLDKEGNIIDQKLAKPGRMYFPRGIFTKTRFILEVHPDHLPKLKQCKRIHWEEING